jgi:sugar lactone lactonase YvrE
MIGGIRMRLRVGIFLGLAITVIGAIFSPVVSANDDVPYKTYINSEQELVPAQTAYQPKEIVSNPKLQKPEDMVLVAGGFYVLDSAAKMVFQLDEHGNVITSFTNRQFNTPTGLYRDLQGNIYVADSIAQAVFKFDRNGRLLKTFKRPSEPLFGKDAPYKPKKIVVDNRNNLYIVGDGATNGIIQLNQDGEFLGYFGANTTGSSLIQAIRRAVGNPLQQSGLFMNVPIAPTNLALGGPGVTYTVTSTATDNAVKKMNVAGNNMLSGVSVSGSPVAIANGPLDNFFLLTAQGQIIEYDSTGQLLFMMGNKGSGEQRVGIFQDPSAIQVDDAGILYVLDRTQRIIQEFSPSDFANEVHQGMTAFNNGDYGSSKRQWSEVNQSNSYFTYATNAIGMAQLRDQQYSAAEQSFIKSNNKKGYSDAFWEIRHQWLENHLGVVLGLLLIIGVVWQILKFSQRKWRVFNSALKPFYKIQQTKPYHDFEGAFRILKHPLDTYYDMRRHFQGSVFSATILMVVLTVELFCQLMFTGFSFNSGLTDTYNPFSILALFWVAFFLFIGVNYLVASITDGEGTFRNVYVGTVYSLSPAVTLLLPVVLLTNVLTLNEQFVIQLGYLVIVGWSVLLLILMIREIHGYSLGEVVRNLVLTLFTIIMFLCVVYILFILGDQVVNFIYEVIREVAVKRA